MIVDAGAIVLAGLEGVTSRSGCIAVSTERGRIRTDSWDEDTQMGVELRRSDCRDALCTVLTYQVSRRPLLPTQLWIVVLKSMEQALSNSLHQQDRLT